MDEQSTIRAGDRGGLTSTLSFLPAPRMVMPFSSDGQLSDIGSLFPRGFPSGTFTSGLAINDSGQVVGASVSRSGGIAVFYSTLYAALDTKAGSSRKDYGQTCHLEMLKDIER
jgi:hypothetical protein